MPSNWWLCRCPPICALATLPRLPLAPSSQRVYRAYAARLVARLPKPASGSLAGSAVLGANDWHVRLSDDDIGVVCLILSTAEHCQVGCAWGWDARVTRPRAASGGLPALVVCPLPSPAAIPPIVRLFPDFTHRRWWRRWRVR